MKAFIDLKSLKDLTVKAGQAARFEVKIGGEPAPEVSWAHNDAPVPAGPSHQTDTRKADGDMKLTTLTIPAAKRYPPHLLSFFQQTFLTKRASPFAEATAGSTRLR